MMSPAAQLVPKAFCPPLGREARCDFISSSVLASPLLSVVNHFADDIAVMYLGQLIEKAPSELLFDKPTHPYTQALLSAIPVPSLKKKRERIILKGEITSPINPKPGCRFAARCPYATDRCRSEEPVLREIEPNHFVACHLTEGK